MNYRKSGPSQLPRTCKTHSRTAKLPPGRRIPHEDVTRCVLYRPLAQEQGHLNFTFYARCVAELSCLRCLLAQQGVIRDALIRGRTAAAGCTSHMAGVPTLIHPSTLPADQHAWPPCGATPSGRASVVPDRANPAARPRPSGLASALRKYRIPTTRANTLTVRTAGSATVPGLGTQDPPLSHDLKISRAEDAPGQHSGGLWT